MADPERRLPEHVTTPLLTLITEHSLDDDYRDVAQRRNGDDATAPAGRPAWVATAVVAVFGVLATTAAVQTSRNADTADAGRATLISRVRAEREAVQRQQAKIVSLQRETIELEGRQEELLADQRELSGQLQPLEVMTGYTPSSSSKTT